MERKAVNEVSLQAANESRMFSTNEMRRSFWELDSYLDEILRKTTVDSETRKASNNAVRGSAGEICGQTDERFRDSDVFFSDDCSADITSTFENQEMKNPLLSCGKLAEIHDWSQNHTPKHSSISVTIDSQSSICVASPPSANQPTGQSNQGANSSSSHELSNDDDGCEQSTDPVSVKCIRRKLSNRDSARRSRKRKQAHLTELESQVINLQEENASLYKHLTDASQLYRNADTNNRVLKSDVEALRAKVKLAEDMVARGSLSYSLNQLLQNHLNVAMEPPMNALRTMSNVSPTMSLQGDGVSFAAMTGSGQNSGLRLGSRDMSGIIDAIKSSMGSDDLSGVSDIWP